MEFLQYFGGVFEPLPFLPLLGGLILGAPPGPSPTMAVALPILLSAPPAIAVPRCRPPETPA